MNYHLPGASICRMYGISGEDLLWKTQSINFSASGFRSDFAPVTMDTLTEAKKRLQQDLMKATSSKLRAQPRGPVMTANVDRSRLPSQKFVAKVPTADVKQEQVAESSLGVSVTTPNISFVGVQNDPESKKKRACMLTFTPFFVNFDTVPFTRSIYV